MDELVRRLENKQRVRAGYASTANELKEAIDRGVVLVEFPDTAGGTCLTVQLDARSKLDAGNFAAREGRVTLVGKLVLNYNEVELTAELDLATLEGEGSLKLLRDEAQWRASRERSAESGDSTAHRVH